MPELKFKPVLQEKVEKKKELRKKEAELRKEFGIDGDKTVGIRTYKESNVIGLWKILTKIIAFIATVIILILASIGLVAILHPSSRDVMLSIWNETYTQFQTFLPFLP